MDSLNAAAEKPALPDAASEQTALLDAAKAQAYLDVKKTLTLVARVFEGAGASPEHAAAVAENLVLAELRGVASHGLSRVKVYCDRLDSKLINLNPEYKFTQNGSAIVMDADNGLGAPAGVAGMDKTIEAARQYGVAACAVGNANHFGIAAYYGMRALAHDMIGMAFTSAPSNVAPWGGIKAYIGTNPLCYAVPAGERRPIVFDAATSIVARGKIILAGIEGKPIPDGWALDRNGNPTSDTAEALAGTVLPFGTYKGYGISIFIDILCAMLSGAEFGRHIGELYANSGTRQNLGHFFVALDISKFTDVGLFKRRVDQMIDEIKANPRAPGVEEIYLPGEIEFDNEEINRKRGLEIGRGVMAELAGACARYQLSLDPNGCVI